MDQLSGPNYKVGEVGALGENIKRGERTNQDGGVETKKAQTWQGERGKEEGKWLIREQAISRTDE